MLLFLELTLDHVGCEHSGSAAHDLAHFATTKHFAADESAACAAGYGGHEAAVAFGAARATRAGLTGDASGLMLLAGKGVRSAAGQGVVCTIGRVIVGVAAAACLVVGVRGCVRSLARVGVCRAVTRVR